MRIPGFGNSVLDCTKDVIILLADDTLVEILILQRWESVSHDS
jgi:hypothetical protein